MRAWFSIFLARLRGVPRVLDALASAALSDAPAACQAPRFGSHPPHDRPPHAGCGLRRLRALAVLPAKCPYCDFNSHVRHAPVDEARFTAAFRREIAACRRAHPGPRRHQHLPRRRHAVADEARNRRRAARRRRRRLDGRPRRPKSRWRPTRPASRPRASAATARPASTGSRSACRRSTTPSCAGSGACTPRTRRSPPCAIAASIFERYLVRPHLRPPGPDAGRLGAELEDGDRATRPSTCRSTSSPSSPAPRSSGCTRPASSSMPDDGRGARALRR